MQSLQTWFKREFGREQNRRANLNLLKAMAFFAGAVIVARNFGEPSFMST